MGVKAILDRQIHTNPVPGPGRIGEDMVFGVNNFFDESDPRWPVQQGNTCTHVFTRARGGSSIVGTCMFQCFSRTLPATTTRRPTYCIGVRYGCKGDFR